MAVRTAFRKYLRFDGTAHAKKPFTLHFGERWVPLMTKLFATEMVRTDDLRVARSWNPATAKTRTGIMWKAVSAAVCIPRGSWR